jgi:hypothetical protein
LLIGTGQLHNVRALCDGCRIVDHSVHEPLRAMVMAIVHGDSAWCMAIEKNGLNCMRWTIFSFTRWLQQKNFFSFTQWLQQKFFFLSPNG